jgi:hypothetical protein
MEQQVITLSTAVMGAGVREPRLRDKCSMESRSDGWYLSGVTMGQPEIEELTLLISENTDKSSALFIIEVLLWPGPKKCKW